MTNIPFYSGPSERYTTPPKGAIPSARVTVETRDGITTHITSLSAKTTLELDSSISKTIEILDGIFPDHYIFITRQPKGQVNRRFDVKTMTWINL